jgi:hypothetical protein
MELKDADGWATARAANTDPYGKCCLDYAEQWADLMEMRMQDGAALEDIAAAASREVDQRKGMGITGFMYGAAVATLAHGWAHGETLRRWHNLKTQLGTEGERANETGGVLNPALLNIGTKG